MDTPNVLYPRAQEAGGEPSASRAHERLGHKVTPRVDKSLNTVFKDVMVEPDRVPGEHHLFVAGDDADAKDMVKGVLGQFGWPPERDHRSGRHRFGAQQRDVHAALFQPR